MRREETHRSTVAWVEKSAVGVRSHLDCGHLRVLTDWVPPRDGFGHLSFDDLDDPDPRGSVSMGGVLPRGHGIGDTVPCEQCPPDVFDDMDMFKDLRGKL